MEDRGYITITEEPIGNWKVEARLVDGNVWLAQHEIARLFGVFVATVRNNLRAIFKNGVLHESQVSRRFPTGPKYSDTFYNLEAIIFLSFRCATLEAQAFRQWMLHGLYEHYRDDKPKEPSVILVYNYDPKQPGLILN
ncbi:hypothetical protein [Rikenella microfusus]|uniref:hypothetical protein n=1 Tax=Rikenella microfusus TaxID=28139 RepID=UPI00248D4E8C|nr:hypothetical protein [Rikenella microfusus]